MKIRYNLEYHTNWGESVYITGNTEALGEDEISRALPMQYTNNGQWSAEIEVDDQQPLLYHYFIGQHGTPILNEWGDPHRIQPIPGRVLDVYDRWQDIPVDKPFLSSAFTKDIFIHPVTPENEEIPHPYLQLSCQAPTLRKEQILAICGESPILGKWDPEHALPMSLETGAAWSIKLPLDKLSFPCSYKFLVLNKEDLKPVEWEAGENRILNVTETADKADISISGLYLHNPLPNWRGTGVAIPVFSLRSEKGFGIGEFDDLRQLVDWAKLTGQRFIQILPVNDTTMTHTWVDSYPYNANSIFALHPVYIHLEEIGTLKDKEAMRKFRAEKKRLNALPQIDYELVNSGKWHYLQAIYQQEGEKTLNSESFKHFFEANRHWLVPYSAFCYLRDQNQTASFDWWSEYSSYNQQEIEALCAPESSHYNEIAIHFFIQYHLHKQLQEVRNYAHKNGVVLKGDIPIGISRDSVDAWTHPQLFNMDSQAGAPPDDFSHEGQNWGFPTYNWMEMEKDHFTWWKKRFTQMAEYFDAYRIDHILGFFRIWEIPEKSVQGLLGHFHPAKPYYPQEMSYYDFWFNEERHARPYIRRYFLNDLFGEYTDEVIDTYLEKGEADTYRMRPEFDTQREIESSFMGQNDEKAMRIREGLFKLVADVLFVPDPYEAGKYHPRISAQYTYSYRGLTDQERNAFNRLYDDFFYHRHDEFWKHEALKKLAPLISATDMLVCGEDLGMIPHCVPEVMEQLQILRLEIQRMPKDPSLEFGIPANYPYLSVCTTSSHDMSTLRGWWEEDRARTQHFYNQVLQESGEAPYFCEPWICEKILKQHLLSPSILAIFPLQDWLSIDGKLRRKNPGEERINIPSIPRHYWRYRMHLTLNELIEATTLNTKIREMITEGGRS